MGILSRILAIKKPWEDLSLEAIAMDSLESSPDEVVELNRVQMREEGILPTGQELKPYAPMTIRFKQEQGKEWRFRTLQDTGAFQSGMYLVMQGNTFTTNSTDPKTSEILQKNGDVFGFTSESQRKLWTDTVRPYTIQAIKNLTGAR